MLMTVVLVLVALALGTAACGKVVPAWCFIVLAGLLFKEFA
jgi:hypothetical protein